MMRYFNIKVNGKAYEVEVEEIEKQGSAPVPGGSADNQKPAMLKPAVSVSGGSPVVAPMPGLIIKLLAADGAAVKKNQKILILEAMKMENDILASADGKVSFVRRQGDSVEAGEVLAVVK